MSDAFVISRRGRERLPEESPGRHTGEGSVGLEDIGRDPKDFSVTTRPQECFFNRKETFRCRTKQVSSSEL